VVFLNSKFSPFFVKNSTSNEAKTILSWKKIQYHNNEVPMKKTDLPQAVSVEKKVYESSVFIAPNATVIGNVTIKKNASIWYGAVCRGDINYIEIGEGTNIQDNAVLHLENDLPCLVGNYVTVGHKAILHACTIEDGVLIGMGAIVLNGAVVKKGAVIGAGAVVKENQLVEENSLYVGIPAKKVKVFEHDNYSKNKEWAEKYIALAKIHKAK
jgi:carbonic anhydrase/acetyltransferase-like protein (isoleucine patch superfamily)